MWIDMYSAANVDVYTWGDGSRVTQEVVNTELEGLIEQRNDAVFSFYDSGYITDWKDNKRFDALCQGNFHNLPW